jgi:2-desacetyl-2-hydroxyethyl bacteriochlorophyllide A dehydrogenase
MKAMVLTDWEKLEVQDVPVPELHEDEALIKVRYAGICGSDLHIYTGHHPTAKTPVIMGHEFIGTVEKINSQKSLQFNVGDRVVVEPLISCGYCEACNTGNWHVCKNLKLLGIHTNGAFAEYVKVAVDKIIPVADHLSDKIAALTEPFAVGFHVNQRAELKNGDTALVIGGGPIGLIVGMVAKISGASKVVFSEINDDRLKQIEDFGFTTLNPAKENAFEKVKALTDNEGFDVVYEVSGSQAGILFATQACKIRGKIVPVGFPSKRPEFEVLQVIFKETTVIGSRVYSFQHFKNTVRMLENIVSNQTFDVEKLIGGVFQLNELEKGLMMMKEGKNIGKLLIECA